MERPAGGIPDTFAEHVQIMFDLQLMAFQADITRVITFMMSREVSPRSYPELGIPDPHHGLSHHQDNPRQMEKLAQLNRHHIEQLAYFLGKLENTPDGKFPYWIISLCYTGAVLATATSICIQTCLYCWPVVAPEVCKAVGILELSKIL